MAFVTDSEPYWGTTRRSKYNWDQWFDGQVWCLEKGTDFEVASGSFRVAALAAARPRGMALKIKVTPDGNVVLKAEKREAVAE